MMRLPYQDYDAGGFWQEVDYAYNIRGWMTAINEPTTSTGQSVDFFGMELFYNSGADAQYNGNISAISWQSDLENYPLLQRYEFDYDGLSRLLSADYMERNPSTGANFSLNVGHFDVDLSYDLNGNIETLQRVARGAPTNSPLNPWDATYSSFTLDNLTYDYTGGGNQLLNVSDAASSNQTTAYAQFLDGSNSGDDYDYDANGNLTQDLNKGISSISYNHLNKPTVITYSNGNIIRYYYSADGMKLRQTVYKANQTDPPQFAIRKRSDYLGAIHYEDPDGDGTTSSLEITFIQHEEGRFRPNGSDMIYEYNLTDHLGNTRITFGDSDADGDADILQENHYYPFGMAMTMSSTLAAAPPNNYLYNGKELQPETGWFDYGARMYDASVGRWNGVDALAETQSSFTSYHYTYNNPIIFTDPSGLAPVYRDGRYVDDEDGSKEYSWDEVMNYLEESKGFASRISRGNDEGTWNASIWIEQDVNVNGNNVATVNHEVKFRRSPTSDNKWELNNVISTSDSKTENYTIVPKAQASTTPDNHTGMLWLGFHINKGEHSISVGAGVNAGVSIVGGSLSLSQNWTLAHSGTSYAEAYTYAPSQHLDRIMLGLAPVPPNRKGPFSNDGSVSATHEILGKVSITRSVSTALSSRVQLNDEWFTPSEIYLPKTKW